MKPMKRLFLLSVILSFGALLPSWGGGLYSTAQAARSSWSHRHYRRITKTIYKRYRVAVKNKWRKPCRSRNRIARYKQWLARLKEQLPSLALRRKHRYYLKYRIRRYRRYARRQHKRTRRWCRRFWKRELKRLKNRLNKRCRRLYRPPLREEGSGLWVGVTPWSYVYLNGVLCGTSPMYASLRPGTYKIRLVYPPGQDEYKTTARLSGGGRAVLIARHMKTPPPAPRRFKNLLAPQQLKWVLKRYSQSLRSCNIYSPRTTQVAMSWQITPQGRVRAVSWVRPTGASSRFRRCLIRALKRIRFPIRKGVARIHSYNISLRDNPIP